MRCLHSLPSYYGYNSALFLAVPSLILLGLWLILQPIYIESRISSLLPETAISEDTTRSFVMSDVRRVAEGTQAMTVYKPIKEIAATAAEMAVDLVKGTAPKFNTKLNNGKKDVDTVLLTPTLLTKDNLDSTVVKDGFYTHQQIFGK